MLYTLYIPQTYTKHTHTEMYRIHMCRKTQATHMQIYIDHTIETYTDHTHAEIHRPHTNT